MNLIDRCFTGKDILIIGPVFPQKLGDVQLVGTPGHTGAAVHALVDFGHFGLPMGGEPVVRGGAADHLGHPGALVDNDAHGAGGAVAAAPAELSQQLAPVPVDDGLQFFGKGGGLLKIGQPFLQLGFPLDAPDGENIVILGHEGHTGFGVIEQSAGGPFMAIKPMFFSRHRSTKAISRSEAR